MLHNIHVFIKETSTNIHFGSLIEPCLTVFKNKIIYCSYIYTEDTIPVQN